MIGLGEKSVRKNYYPQLQAKLRELEASEQKYHALFDGAYQLTIAISPEGLLLEANRAALNLVESGGESLLGRPIIDTPWWSHPQAARRQLLAALHSARSGVQSRFETIVSDVSGNMRLIDMSVKPVLHPDGSVACLLLEGRDVTGYDETARQLRQMKDLYRVLSQVNSAVARRRDEQGLLQEICGVAASIEQVNLVWVGFVNNHGQPEPVAWAGEAVPVLLQLKQNDPKGESVARLGEVILSEKPSTGSEWPSAEYQRVGELVRRFGLRSFAVFPLVLEARQGVLAIYSKESEFFQRETVGLFEEMASNLSFALNNLHYERLRRNAEATAARLGREAEIQNELLRLTLEERDLQQYLKRGVSAIISSFWQETGAQGGVFLLTADGSHLDLAAQINFTPEQVSLCRRVTVGECLCGEVAKNGATRHQAGCPRHADLVDGSCRFHHVLPLRSENHLLGVLTFFLPDDVVQRNVEPGFLQTVADIFAIGIARKQTDIELLDHDALLQKVLDTIPLPIYYAGIDLVFQGCNESFARDIFDLPKEQIIGQTADQLLGEERAGIYRDADLELLKGGESLEYETDVFYADGSVHRVMFNKGLILRDDGSPIGIVGVFLDLTSYKRLEEQLRHAQKVEALGTLTGGIAHDFNNLLTAIMGYGSILQQKLPDKDPLAGVVERIFETTEKAAKLTNALLTFSRKKVADPKPIDLNEAVRGVLHILGRVLHENIHLEVDLQDPSPVVLADGSQLEQVLVNLATNGRDAMPDGGKLLIRVERFNMDRSFVKLHGYGKPGKYAVLSVTDNGCGIPEELQSRIFDPFFTTKAPGRGTGLGLAVTYGIVKQHKGYISVYSEVGVGTTFRIYLPLETRLGSFQETAEVVWQRGQGECVLLVEDNDLVREATRSLLEEFGYRVIEACDGLEARQVFNERREEIDLVLTDIIMPGVSGLQLGRSLLRDRPDLPILYTSGYTFDVLEDQAGVSELDILAKPVAPAVMLARIRAKLESGTGAAVK